MIETLDKPAHPDVGWELPKWQPPAADLRAAVSACEQALRGRVTTDFAKQCYIKLMANFEANTKLTAEETKLRLVVWLEAAGDFSNALWKHATDCSIRSLKWMPKVAEFRAFADEEIHKTKQRLDRLQKMLAAQQRPVEKPYEREPPEVRIKGMRDSFRRVGNIRKASEYERQLAGHEKREPEGWALEVSTEVPQQAAERPPFTPGSSPMDKHMAELAEKHRKKAAA